MKNYLIAILLVGNLILASIIYRSSRVSIYHGFPYNKLNNVEDAETPLYLFLFFSMQSCSPCLDVIEVLNRLPEEFKVIGIVPERELSDEKALRAMTGAKFELIGHKGSKKFIPPYVPALLGVSKSNKVFFILPGVPNEEEYLEQFLMDFYHKAYPLLEQ